ncbi:MAG: hypothetical protein DWI02_00735 [Planctomycetota bacterium]|nr:MAG: hypothetical protein DWI02_00735 [Planctomycetota bacterium]
MDIALIYLRSSNGLFETTASPSNSISQWNTKFVQFLLGLFPRPISVRNAEPQNSGRNPLPRVTQNPSAVTTHADEASDRLRQTSETRLPRDDPKTEPSHQPPKLPRRHLRFLDWITTGTRSSLGNRHRFSEAFERLQQKAE